MSQKNQVLYEERKILILDPSDNDRKIMAHFLRSHGFQVETEKGLSEAIQKISESSFACIIMEVNLTERKGYEAVPMIKNIDPQTKIIMTTKKNTRTVEAKVREQDIFYYFIKSFEKEADKIKLEDSEKVKQFKKN